MLCPSTCIPPPPPKAPPGWWEYVWPFLATLVNGFLWLLLHVKHFGSIVFKLVLFIIIITIVVVVIVIIIIIINIIIIIFCH